MDRFNQLRLNKYSDKTLLGRAGQQPEPGYARQQGSFEY